jgi:hypothetical protein
MNSSSNLQAIDRLADFLADDVVRTQGADLLAEVLEDHGSSGALAVTFDRVMDSALRSYQPPEVDEIQAIDRLADFLADDVVRTQGADLLAEVLEDHRSSGALAVTFDRVMDSVLRSYQPPEVDGRVAELKRYLIDVGATLAADLRRALLVDAGLRRKLHQLWVELAEVREGMTLPTVAAASDGELSERRFEGGVVRLAKSAKDAREVYVIIEFDRSFLKARPHSFSPTVLLLCSPDGRVAKLALESSDQDGIVQDLLNTADEEKKQIVELLRDPLTIGRFW